MFAFLLLLIPSVVISTKHGGSFASINFDSNLQFSNYFASSHATSYCSTMVHTSLSKSKSTNYFSLASSSNILHCSTPYLTMVHNSLSKIKSTNYFSLASSSNILHSSTPYLTMVHASLSKIKSTNYFSLASSSNILHSSTPYLTMVHASLSKIKSTNYFSLASLPNILHCSTPYLTMVHASLSKTKSVNYFSLSGTIAPSPAPTPIPVTSILSFETALSLSGLSEPVLDDPAQTAVTVAVANSANVSAQFVIFVKQRPLSSNIQNYLFELESPTYAIEATTQLNIPVSGVNPNTLYSTLSNSIVVAVGNGDFNVFLVAASIAVNSTSTQNAVSTDVVVTPMIILVPSPMPSVNPSVFISKKPSPAPRYKPSRKPSPNPSPMPSKIPFQSSHSQKKSEEVALFIMIGFTVLCIIVYYYFKRRDQNHIILDIQDI